MLMGPRRAGKTTLMFQVIHHVIGKKDIPPRDILYVSLDHLTLSECSIPEIIEVFRAEFQHGRKHRLFVFLDEIQNSPNWAQHLKNLVDFENLWLCVAGSSSLLIERQSTFLTGRALRNHIYPLNYVEFLTFKDRMPGPTEMYRHEGLLLEYLYQGGYPEHILNPHPTYLTDLLDAVINKDIVRVHGIKNPQILSKILLLLSQRIGQRTSHSKLKNILRVSQDLVRNYVHYLMEAYVVERSQLRIYEAKFTNQIDDDTLKPLIKFIDKFPKDQKLREPTIVTRNLDEIRTFGKIRIKCVPLWKLLLDDE